MCPQFPDLSQFSAPNPGPLVKGSCRASHTSDASRSSVIQGQNILSKVKNKLLYLQLTTAKKKIQHLLSATGVFFFWFLTFIYSLLERGKGRKKQRERNIDVRGKHRSLASCLQPNRGPGLQPRHVPWPGIKLATFHFALATPARARALLCFEETQL